MTRLSALSFRSSTDDITSDRTNTLDQRLLSCNQLIAIINSPEKAALLNNIWERRASLIQVHPQVHLGVTSEEIVKRGLCALCKPGAPLRTVAQYSRFFETTQRLHALFSSDATLRVYDPGVIRAIETRVEESLHRHHSSYPIQQDLRVPLALWPYSG